MDSKTNSKGVASLFRVTFRSLLIYTLLMVNTGFVFAQASDPDLNNDGVVDILDVSLVGSCIGQDLRQIHNAVRQTPMTMAMWTWMISIL